MKRTVRSIVFGLTMLALLGGEALAQVQFRVPLYLSWGTKADTIFVGVNGGNGTTIQAGTYGLDLVTTNNFGVLGLYGESGSPPPDADGNRVRFIDVNGRTQIGAAGGLFKYDFRGFTSAAQSDSFAVELTGLVVENNNLTVSWGTTLNQYGTGWGLYARSGSSAGAQLANMLTQTSYTFTASGNPQRFVIVKNGASVPAPVGFSAAPVNFGTVNVGVPATQNLVVTNSGLSQNLTITAIAAPSAPYSYTGPALPLTLTPGQSATYVVTFAPTVGGTFNSAMVFTHNAPGSPTSVALSGTASSVANMLYFVADSVTRLDNTADVVETLRLNITDTLKVAQFQIRSNGLSILRSIAKGSDLLAAPFTSSSWNFNSQIYRATPNEDGSSNDSIIVVVYGNGNTVLLPGDYAVATFRYDVVNISEPDVQVGSFVLSNVVGSDPLGNNLGISADAPQVLVVNNRTVRGDVNNDGAVDILDILPVVDHILQRRLLDSFQFSRANVAPWATPDAVVNALDLAVIQSIALTGRYPDNQLLGKVNPALIAHVSGTSDGSAVSATAEAELTFHVTKNGIAVRLANTVPVKGIQFDFGDFAGVPALSNVESFFGEGYASTVRNQVRLLAYSSTGAILEPGERIVANLPLAIDNPIDMNVTGIIVAGADNKRLTQVSSTITLDAAPELPVEFSLNQNYPNPFNPSTDIQFTVPESSPVKIIIYNTLGQEVRTLFAGQMERGTRVVRWDGRDNFGMSLSSGTYLYRMVAGSHTETKKMLLLK